jgi:general secretion pathway protein D
MPNDGTVILAGLIQDDERKTKVTVPGLGDIPILGALFSSTTTDTITTEIVLSITPHVVRNVTTPALETQAFWSGTETNYSTSPLFTEGSASPAKTSLATGSEPAKAKALPPATGVGPTSPLPKPPAATSAPPSPPTPTAPTMVAGGPAVLALRPAELTGFVGQEIRLDLTGDNIQGLNESAVTIVYDPQVVEFRRAIEGELLKREASDASITLSADPTSGRTQLQLRRQGPPLSGSGVLASLIFQGKKAGVSAVDIVQPTIGNGESKATAVNVVRGQIRIR